MIRFNLPCSVQCWQTSSKEDSGGSALLLLLLLLMGSEIKAILSMKSAYFFSIKKLYITFTTVLLLTQKMHLFLNKYITKTPHRRNVQNV